MSSTEVPLDLRYLPKISDPTIALLVQTLENNRIRLLEKWQQQQDVIAALAARISKLESLTGSA